MIRLNRSLYIGLGGTGISAILHTKKMFLETYGEVPPMVGFLGIDVDDCEYYGGLDSKMGEISLELHEQLCISVYNPSAFYQHHCNGDLLSWFPPENEKTITTLDKGTRQIRTNGRLAVVMKASDIVNTIQGTINLLRSIEISNSEKYELINSAKDDIHLVFSLCGGFGSGSFIDIAYFIGEVAGRSTINLNGYAVLPGVFVEMIRNIPSMPRVKTNTYAAIRDLDYLMNLAPYSPKIEFKYAGETITTNYPPFSAINLIDNKNESGMAIEHINQLTEMIALTLFTLSGGEISNILASIDDTSALTRYYESLNVGNKRSWVSSIGVCEIVFKGHELANIYAHKAAIRIIQQTLIPCEDANCIAIANNWIDKREVNIRKNGEYYYLIDQICNAYPKYYISDVGDEYPCDEIEKYFRAVIPSDEELNEKMKTISKGIIDDLHELVVDCINRDEGCVATTLLVLEDILQQVEIFADEMNVEIESFSEKLIVLEYAVKEKRNNLQYQLNRSFLIPGKKRRIEEAKDDIVDAVRQVAITEIEVKRRYCAVNIYAALKNAIRNELNKINFIKDTLSAVKEEFEGRILSIQNYMEKRTSICEIDLSKGAEITIDDKDMNYLTGYFITSLPGNGMYELGDTLTTRDALLNYTKGLPDAKNWESKTIDSVLGTLSDYEFSELVRDAYEKAKPWLKIDGRGYYANNGLPLEQAICKHFFVGLSERGSSRFTRSDAFRNLLPANMDVNFFATNKNDRIIFYRQDCVVPAFAIDFLESYRYDYENSTIFPGFDVNLHKRMLDEGFDLYPNETMN